MQLSSFIIIHNSYAQCESTIMTLPDVYQTVNASISECPLGNVGRFVDNAVRLQARREHGALQTRTSCLGSDRRPSAPRREVVGEGIEWTHVHHVVAQQPSAATQRHVDFRYGGVASPHLAEQDHVQLALRQSGGHRVLVATDAEDVPNGEHTNPLNHRTARVQFNSRGTYIIIASIT